MSPWYASRPLITFGRSSARHSWPRFHTITSLVEIPRAILFPSFATGLDYSWVPHWSSLTIRTLTSELCNAVKASCTSEMLKILLELSVCLDLARPWQCLPVLSMLRPNMDSRTRHPSINRRGYKLQQVRFSDLS